MEELNLGVQEVIEGPSLYIIIFIFVLESHIKRMLESWKFVLALPATASLVGCVPAHDHFEGVILMI